MKGTVTKSPNLLIYVEKETCQEYEDEDMHPLARMFPALSEKP